MLLSMLFLGFTLAGDFYLNVFWETVIKHDEKHNRITRQKEQTIDLPLSSFPKNKSENVIHFPTGGKQRKNR